MPPAARKELAQALGHVQGQGLNVPLHGPAPIVFLQYLPLHERLHQSDEKHGLAIRPLVQPRCECCRELLLGKACREIRHDRGGTQ